jgi:hypothetical protein
MKKLLQLFSVFFVLLSCGPDRSTPEYAAKQYLTALKNKDWETAEKYSIYFSEDEFNMIAAEDDGFGITEIKDIKCEINGSKAICYFCCSNDSSFNRVAMILNDKNKWVANHSKASWFDYNYWDQIK